MSNNTSARRWCFTVNNYESFHEEILVNLPFVYLVYGREKGASGTPHLQGFVTFKSTKRLSALKKLLPSAHWEITKGTSKQAADYCKKEDPDFFESGHVPTQGKRNDLTSAIETLRESNLQTVAEDHPEVFVKYGRGLRDLALTIQKPYNHTTTRGLWVWGPPGTGKSHAARDAYPDAFLKSQSKWWDGYAMQSSVILDDLDTPALGHYLKIWADKYACTGETKGGTVALQHHYFVVTSNYSPDDLWKEDDMMAKAITRRFRIVHKTTQEQGLFDPAPVERHYLGGCPLGPEEERDYIEPATTPRMTQLMALYRK